MKHHKRFLTDTLSNLHLLHFEVERANQNEELKDVHTGTVFKNLIARKTGSVPLLEGESEQALYYRQPAEKLAPLFLQMFPPLYLKEFAKNLLEILEDTKSSEKVETATGFILFSELRFFCKEGLAPQIPLPCPLKQSFSRSYRDLFA